MTSELKPVIYDFQLLAKSVNAAVKPAMDQLHADMAEIGRSLARGAGSMIRQAMEGVERLNREALERAEQRKVPPS